MLQSLHVKNLALIDETEVDFEEWVKHFDPVRPVRENQLSLVLSIWR